MVVEVSGRPRLIDFQLASLHPRRSGRRFDARCGDDLRHPGLSPLPERSRPAGLEIRVLEVRRRGLALLWRRTGKPAYLFITRGLLGTKDGEDRRSFEGPWPSWDGPLESAPQTPVAPRVTGGTEPGSS